MLSYYWIEAVLYILYQSFVTIYIVNIFSHAYLFIFSMYTFNELMFIILQIQRFMFTSHGAKKWWHGNVHTDLPSLLLVVYNPDDRSLPSLPGEYLHLSKLRRLIWSLCSSLGIFHFCVSHDCGILQTSGHASVLINKGRRSWLYAFIWHLFFSDHFLKVSEDNLKRASTPVKLSSTQPTHCLSSFCW